MKNIKNLIFYLCICMICFCFGFAFGWLCHLKNWSGTIEDRKALVIDVEKIKEKTEDLDRLIRTLELHGIEVDKILEFEGGN